MKVSQLPPPELLAYIGGGDPVAVGDHFLNHSVKLAGLQPHHRVLDVGCGVGRIALAFSEYLNKKGSYDGFDIVDVGIEWCRKNITSVCPNFRFHAVDVYNRGYNPMGTCDA